MVDHNDISTHDHWFGSHEPNPLVYSVAEWYDLAYNVTNLTKKECNESFVGKLLSNFNLLFSNVGNKPATCYVFFSPLRITRTL